jgi:hypothetical protein
MSGYDVDELFCGKNIDQIKSHISDVKSEIASTHTKLRSLVSDRYRDLLHSSDVIVRMGQICEEITALSGCMSPTSKKLAPPPAKGSRTSEEHHIQWGRVSQCVPNVWDALDKGLYLNAATLVLQCQGDIATLKLIVGTSPGARPTSTIARETLERWIREIGALPQTILVQCSRKISQPPFTHRREQHAFSAMLLLQPADPLTTYFTMYRSHFKSVEISQHKPTSARDIALCVDMLANAVAFIEGAFVHKGLSSVPAGVHDDAMRLVNTAMTTHETILVPEVATKRCAEFVEEATESLARMLSRATQSLATVAGVRQLVAELDQHASLHTRTGLYDVERWVQSMYRTAATQTCALLQRCAATFAIDLQKGLSNNTPSSPKGPAAESASLRPYKVSGTAGTSNGLTKPQHIYDESLSTQALRALSCIDALHTMACELHDAQAFARHSPQSGLNAAIETAVKAVCDAIRAAQYPTDIAVSATVRQGIARAVVWYLTPIIESAQSPSSQQSLSGILTWLHESYITCHMPWIEECVKESCKATGQGVTATYWGPDRVMFKRLHSTHWATRSVDEASVDIPIGPSDYIFEVIMSVSNTVCSATPCMLRSQVIQRLHQKLSVACVDTLSKALPDTCCEEGWFQAVFDVQYLCRTLHYTPSGVASQFLRRAEDAVDPVNWSVCSPVMEIALAKACQSSRLLFACHFGQSHVRSEAALPISGDAGQKVTLFKECERFTLLPITPMTKGALNAHSLARAETLHREDSAGALKEKGSQGMMRYLGWAS